MAENFEWRIEDHVCRVCFSRVLSRRTFDGKRIYRCASCGTEREGTGPAVICSCGIKLRPGHGPMDAGIRCAPNPAGAPENMSEFVAIQVEAPKASKAPSA